MIQTSSDPNNDMLSILRPHAGNLKTVKLACNGKAYLKVGHGPILPVIVRQSFVPKALQKIVGHACWG